MPVFQCMSASQALSNWMHCMQPHLCWRQRCPHCFACKIIGPEPPSACSNSMRYPLSWSAVVCLVQMERRDRLRHLLATADDDTAAKLTTQDGQQQETTAESLADKVFYTEGTDALKEARTQVGALISHGILLYLRCTGMRWLYCTMTAH